MQFEDNTVGKTNSCELDVTEELKVEERMNLFAVFPIGTAMQDGSKRKRSNVLIFVGNQQRLQHYSYPKTSLVDYSSYFKFFKQERQNHHKSSQSSKLGYLFQNPIK